jgi:hypothetical protein
MAALPVLDAIALMTNTMFEKAHPVSDCFSPGLGASRLLSDGASGASSARFAPRGPRRTGDALRAVEWHELTARLKAARDLRLLLRTEGQAPIEAIGASFGDAAASYFALLDDSEHGVNPDALEQSKPFHDSQADSDTNRPDENAVKAPVVARGDVREM